MQACLSSEDKESFVVPVKEKKLRPFLRAKKSLFIPNRNMSRQQLCNHMHFKFSAIGKCVKKQILRYVLYIPNLTGSTSGKRLNTKKRFKLHELQ